MRTHEIAAAGFAVAASIAAVGIATGQTYIHPLGYFDPSGAIDRPFQTIAGGICGGPIGGDRVIAPGSYFETFASNRPCRLTSSSLVRIGATPAEHTTFRIAGYNTHLFGNEALGVLPDWLDPQRAVYIGTVLHDENADVVGLQEVWDPDLFATIRDIANFPSGFYGGAVELGGLLDSGLFMMSRQPLQNPVQVFYLMENPAGEDQFASKGFIRATVAKDGFAIAIFDTHTQAQDDFVSRGVRQQQIQQLANAAQAYRVANPTHVVIVHGDFNVPGETSEYVTSMRNAFGSLGFKDCARNVPCSGLATTCTTCTDNDLNLYFNPSATDTRLDYFLYVDSLDGTVKVRPEQYEQRHFEIPAAFPPLSHDGLTTRTLSDHYGVAAEFTLYR